MAHHHADAGKPLAVFGVSRKPLVVFVLGGPGSGKGTQCANIVRDYGFVHLSAGDLLRAARQSGGPDGDLIETYIREGKIVPVEITVNLIKKAMEEAMRTQGKTRFLVDGFPRNLDNLNGWHRVMGDFAVVKFTLFLECPEEIMEKRLLERGKTSGRVDDNIESIKKRFRTFISESMPIVDGMRNEGKLRQVNSEPSAEDVYKEITRIFDAEFGKGDTITFAFIKPDVVRAGRHHDMLEEVRAAGFRVVAQKEITLTRAQAEEFYAEHKGKPFFEGLVSFMTGGPAVALALAKVDAVPEWRKLLGPTNTQKAQSEAPNSLRARYGTDGTQNAGHGSDSAASAARELSIIFPELADGHEHKHSADRTDVTFAFIKPDVVRAGKHEQMLADIRAAGFKILALKKITLTHGQAEQFYAEHKGKPFFDGLVAFMTGGPAVALALQKADAIAAWRKALGPTNTQKAQAEAPESLRARYGTDGTQNAGHGSDSPASAARELGIIFPE